MPPNRLNHRPRNRPLPDSLQLPLLRMGHHQILPWAAGRKTDSAKRATWRSTITLFEQYKDRNGKKDSWGRWQDKGNWYGEAITRMASWNDRIIPWRPRKSLQTGHHHRIKLQVPLPRLQPKNRPPRRHPRQNSHRLRQIHKRRQQGYWVRRQDWSPKVYRVQWDFHTSYKRWFLEVD